MANPLTRKELAKFVNRSPQQIGVYVNRGKLIEENRMIDIDHPINKAWIAKNTIKSLNETKDKPTKQVKREYTPLKKKPVKEEVPDLGDFDLSEFDESSLKANTIDALKKKHEISKLKADIKLKDLEYARKKARVLPLDFVIDWSGRTMRGIFGEGVNFGHGLVEQLCNELGADIETKLEYKKKFKQGFQEIVRLGVQNQEPEALEQAKEYALTTKW